MSRRRGPWTRTERLSYHLLRGSSRLLRAVPSPVAAAFGRLAGRVFWLFFPQRRKIARENLDLVFGDSLSSKRKDRIACLSFQYLFEDAFVLLASLGLGAERLGKIVQIRDKVYLDEALSKGKGVIILSGHLSNFPLASSYLGRLGIPVGVFVRPMAFRPTERLATELRATCGIRSFDQGASAIAPVRHLRAGGVLWFALDQSARRGVYVEFFGRPAGTSPGPVRLARTLRVPIVPAFVHRLGPARYELQIQAPLALPPTEPTQEELEADLKKLLGHIEAQILRYPEEWLWVHRRWR